MSFLASPYCHISMCSQELHSCLNLLGPKDCSRNTGTQHFTFPKCSDVMCSCCLVRCSLLPHLSIPSHHHPRAGVGKTTAIRELSRLLADDLQRRVVIVDTSNEIGGDGDVPHVGIGRARRMQVRDWGCRVGCWHSYQLKGHPGRGRMCTA